MDSENKISIGRLAWRYFDQHTFNGQVRDDVLFLQRAGYPFPLNETDLVRALSHPKVNAMVFTDTACDNLTVGYLIYEATNRHLKIVALAVLPDYRRLGVGSQMMETLRQRLTNCGQREIRALVRESNLAGQLFLKSQGFLAKGMFPGRINKIAEELMLFQLVAESDVLEAAR